MVYTPDTHITDIDYTYNELDNINNIRPLCYCNNHLCDLSKSIFNISTRDKVISYIDNCVELGYLDKLVVMFDTLILCDKIRILEYLALYDRFISCNVQHVINSMINKYYNIVISHDIIYYIVGAGDYCLLGDCIEYYITDDRIVQNCLYLALKYNHVEMVNMLLYDLDYADMDFADYLIRTVIRYYIKECLISCKWNKMADKVFKLI